MRALSKAVPIRRFLMLLITMALAAVGVVGVTGTASAAMQPALCTGYSACIQAGYTDHGYGASNGTSYWHEFTGDNCTNYAAYLEVLNNFSSQGQYSPGDASNWGSYFSSYENSTPAVGSIAWWGGTQGDHVGNVERIAYNSNGSVNSITVSEDNWGGSFDWRVYLASDSANWPSGFLHFRDQSSSGSPGAWGGVGSATFLGGNHLSNGQRMYGSQYVLSDDGRFVLLMQSDGNLVEYTASGPLWASNTSGHPGAYLGMQSDGNVVIYASNGVALWATGQKGIQTLAIQTDGNLVALNSAGAAVWANNQVDGTLGLNYKGSDHLNDGMTMVQKQYLRSSDGRYFLVMHSDGSLDVYAPGWRLLWTSNSGGHSNAYLGMQSDGNVVVYTSDGAVWATGQMDIQVLRMQSDGNLVALNSAGAAVWATGTNGRL